MHLLRPSHSPYDTQDANNRPSTFQCGNTRPDLESLWEMYCLKYEALVDVVLIISFHNIYPLTQRTLWVYSG